LNNEEEAAVEKCIAIFNPCPIGMRKNYRCSICKDINHNCQTCPEEKQINKKTPPNTIKPGVYVLGECPYNTNTSMSYVNELMSEDYQYYSSEDEDYSKCKTPKWDTRAFDKTVIYKDDFMRNYTFQEESVTDDVAFFTPMVKKPKPHESLQINCPNPNNLSDGDGFPKPFGHPLNDKRDLFQKHFGNSNNGEEDRVGKHHSHETDRLQFDVLHKHFGNPSNVTRDANEYRVTKISPHETDQLQVDVFQKRLRNPSYVARDANQYSVPKRSPHETDQLQLDEFQLDVFPNHFGNRSNVTGDDDKYRVTKSTHHENDQLQLPNFHKQFGNPNNVTGDAFQQHFGNSDDTEHLQFHAFLKHLGNTTSKTSYAFATQFGSINEKHFGHIQNSAEIPVTKINSREPDLLQITSNQAINELSQGSVAVTKVVKPSSLHKDDHKSNDISVTFDTPTKTPEVHRLVASQIQLGNTNAVSDIDLTQGLIITKVVPPKLEISEAILQDSILQAQLGIFDSYPSHSIECNSPGDDEQFHCLITTILKNGRFMHSELLTAMLPINDVKNDNVPLHTIVLPQFDTMTLQVPLRALKLQLLSDDWLHCDLVDCWTILLNHSYSQIASSQSTFVTTTYFYNKHFESDVYSVEKLMKWVKKSRLDQMRLKQFVIPIHINAAHWFLIVIRKTTKEIWLIDSLPNAHPGIYFNNIMRFWADYMHLIGEGDIDCSQWKFFVKSCTRQEDFDSCGIFMCSNMLLLCNGCTNFKYPQNWADSFRRYMVYCFHLPYLVTMEDVCQMCGRWCVGNCSFCNEVKLHNE
jgi:hypothetical protein